MIRTHKFFCGKLISGNSSKNIPAKTRNPVTNFLLDSRTVNFFMLITSSFGRWRCPKCRLV